MDELDKELLPFEPIKEIVRKESTILVEITENDYQENFSDLIHRGEPFEWCFPTLEDKLHYITIRFVPEEEEL